MPSIFIIFLTIHSSSLKGLTWENLLNVDIGRIEYTCQVAGGAGSSTSPQTRPAKFSYAADAAQLQHSSGPILARLLKPAEENETRHTLKNPQLHFASACLAEAGGRRRRRRRPHPTAINVSVQSPIIRSSRRPLRSHSSRGPDPNALTSCCHRCSAAVEMPGSTAGCQRLGRRRLRSTPPTSITASLRATPARPAVLRSSSQPCALFLSLHHR